MEIFLEFGPLEQAVFLDRPNRFLLVCRLEKSGELVEAHLADPGRLEDLLRAGATLYLRQAFQAHRKTKWSAVLVEASNGALVSLQSTLVNTLTEKALRQGALTEFRSWDLVRPEFSWAGSRWDFLLEDGRGRRLILEVKSVSLVENGVALFPDAVTARGRRHVQGLAYLAKHTDLEAAILFVVQRSDAFLFQAADQIDPAFGQSLRQARQEGVQVFVRSCRVALQGISLGESLPADFA